MPSWKPFNELWSELYDYLDSYRERWFELIRELLVEEVETRFPSATVDTSFEPTRRLPLSKIPEGFPFGEITSETIEATIMAWQVQVVVGFSLSQNYISEREISAFVEAQVAGVKSATRWELSLPLHAAAEPLDGEALAKVLAHYFLNDPSEGSAVAGAEQFLREKGLPGLGLLTHLATAFTFADQETTMKLLKQLNII